MNKISSFYMYRSAIGLHYQSKEQERLEVLTISRFSDGHLKRTAVNIELTLDEIDLIRTALHHIDLDKTNE